MIKVDYLALFVFDRENLLQLLWGRRESRRCVIDLSLKEHVRNEINIMLLEIQHLLNLTSFDSRSS